MRTWQLWIASLLVAGLGSVAVAVGGALTVTSSAFKNHGAIPADNTCDGRATPPPISWGDVPTGTKTLAVIVSDPDAPQGTYDHFVAFNLPPTRRSLASDAMGSIGPGSALRTAHNSAGDVGFAPICPPAGTHHYHFRVMALDTVLDLPPTATAADVERAASNHVLAQGELVGTYSRR